MSDLDLNKDPAFHLHYCRVLITEAKKRRAAGQPNMVATLVGWALNGRRRYYESLEARKAAPDQGEMFDHG